MKRCSECEEARNKWLDYRPTFSRYKPYASSAERAWKGAIEGYSMHADDHRTLVRRQLALIDEICSSKHQAVAA